jgi:transcription initiation factor TFIID subunit 2
MASTPLIDDGVAPVAAAPKYSISQQDVDIDIDFAQRCIRGTTRIVVEPLERDLRELKFSCRQMIIKRVKVDRYPVYNYEYDDPYKSLTIRDEYTVHQHHWMKDNVMNGFTHKADPDLRIPMPPKMRVQSEGRVLLRLGSSLSLANSVPTPVSATADDGSSNFKKFTVEIQYEMRNVRDGLHWVGLEDGDHRYPHVYTYSNSLVHTLANYVFPCVDQADKKFLWRVSITCPRTLGDIYAPSALSKKTQENEAIKNGEKKGMFNGGQVQAVQDVKNINSPFSEAEKGLEMQVVCSGYMEDADAPTEDNDRRRKWIFSCATPVLPRHIGFSIGPFEEVDLSQYRESGQDDKMGMSAVSVHGFCLPGRSDELRNTCMPLASALDKLSTQFVFYPFESESSSYKVAFVDDLPMNVVDTATLSICSSRLLVQDDIIDPLHESTRELVHAVASQWLGVKITPQAQDDNWLIVGGSYFMADWFMTTLWGRNEHRFRLKVAADKVHELDVNRPSLIYLGGAIEVDPDEYEFLKLKAPLVLSILHHRILKANGRIGVNRALSRVLFDDQNGKLENSILDTSQFQRACEKVSHGRLDSFFNQWVYGRGCPTFRITQRFNKKKLVVEMLIVQVQAEEQVMGGTTSESFMREAKESVEEVEKGNIPLLFTGPMTMRIHEADGTPYEHIVDIKELTTKVEIPYNTKYKRLKRNRRAKERAAAAAGVDISGEPQDDALLYCLGDVLQSEEEIREWDLADWSKEDDDKMNNEHFEWIRLDKDFEWIAKISFNQPHYMWVSQLQQDNDVIAQTESLQYLLTQQPFKLVSTILIRTLIDTRYFYGIRVIAAHALARCGTAELDWIGLKHLQKAFREFYCLEKSNMTRSNDFSDLRNYRIQCAIPEAIAMIRDSSGRAPDQVKKFFLDCLKYNDNSNNEYSDSFYISTLMSGLAQALVAVGSRAKPTRVSDEDLMAMTDEEQQNIMDQEESRSKQQLLDVEFQRSALEEIQRFRRIDEWIPSFQNQYTTTTLEGVKNLMLNKLMPKRLKDFLYYTRPQNSAYVRSKAFDCLIDLGAFEEPSVMSYFIVSFFEESSPYFRCRLWKVIGRGFAEIALKEKTEVIVQSDPMFGLVLESTEKVNKDRRLAFARTQTIAGIISVLKERVGGLQELEDVLLEAIK